MGSLTNDLTVKLEILKTTHFETPSLQVKPKFVGESVNQKINDPKPKRKHQQLNFPAKKNCAFFCPHQPNTTQHSSPVNFNCSTIPFCKLYSFLPEVCVCGCVRQEGERWQLLTSYVPQPLREMARKWENLNTSKQLPSFPGESVSPLVTRWVWVLVGGTGGNNK